MPSDNSTITSIQIPNSLIIPQIIDLLNNGHTVTINLKGISMRPFLENNRDKAVLKKADADCLKVSDAVLAEIRNKTYVLHRIIKIEGQNVTLQGDGNLSVEHCHINDIHGIATGFYRKNHTYLDRTGGLKWKAYSFVWMKLSPIRRYLLAIHRRCIIPLTTIKFQR